ncbi:MAG: hypothetical protein M0R32_08115 [Candidatus Cloacimonetes bacterium]|jgi:hypothetical protein|nr:hypothetical protein [Candidatus Cloacimonadota bacterium]
MSKVVHAKDLKCCTCKTEQAVAFWPFIDPDIKSHPYCQKCLDKTRDNLLLTMFLEDEKREKAEKRRKKEEEEQRR